MKSDGLVLPLGEERDQVETALWRAGLKDSSMAVRYRERYKPVLSCKIRPKARKVNIFLPPFGVMPSFSRVLVIEIP